MLTPQNVLRLLTPMLPLLLKVFPDLAQGDMASVIKRFIRIMCILKMCLYAAYVLIVLALWYSLHCSLLPGHHAAHHATGIFFKVVAITVMALVGLAVSLKRVAVSRGYLRAAAAVMALGFLAITFQPYQMVKAHTAEQARLAKETVRHPDAAIKNEAHKVVEGMKAKAAAVHEHSFFHKKDHPEVTEPVVPGSAG